MVKQFQQNWKRKNFNIY